MMTPTPDRRRCHGLAARRHRQDNGGTPENMHANGEKRYEADIPPFTGIDTS